MIYEDDEQAPLDTLPSQPNDVAANELLLRDVKPRLLATQEHK
jgi:hypothetical protein